MNDLPRNQHNADRPVKADTKRHLLKVMDEVLAKARAAGATAAMVSTNHDDGFSVDVRMGAVETIAFHENKGMHLSVYLNHQKGEASSTDTSPKAIETLVEAACEIAKVSASDPCFGLPDASLMGADYRDLDLYHPWAINPQEAIELALACESSALSFDPRITNSDGVNVTTSKYCHGFANTQGASGLIQSTEHRLSCSLIAKQGEAMQRDYAYAVACRAADLRSFDEIAKQAAERTVARLGARQIKTEKVPVIFSPRVSTGLFSSLISAISGGNLYRKSSFLLDSLGQSIFPTYINVYEQPFLLRGLGSSPFDGEGVPTRENRFIENGILRSYVLGSYSARRLGLQTTANSGGVHNLTIDATTGNLTSLLKKMHRGLLVTELMGQGVNGLTGDYSRGASGFWIEEGEIQFPVEEITIAGNLKTMFQSIIDVGNDIDPNRATRCGSILIDGMTVAGS
ncbi:MAG: metalloprotease PmbA [Legionella sp.]|nr:metalloprotease PmbA [Legionella sp.]